MHLDLLSQMVNLPLDSLVIPHPLTDLRRADEVMWQFLAKDIYQDQPSFGPRLGGHRRDKRVIRMSELLFKSLRDHTERKVPWQVLDIWKGARDSCVKDIECMKKETREVFTNILNQESKLKEKLDKGYMNSSVTENIKKGILINIWLSGITGVNSQVTAMKGISLTKKGTGWVVFHENTPAETNVTFDRGSPSGNEWLAREVSNVSV